jgi:hypothetical protein
MGKLVQFHPSACTIICCCVSIAAICKWNHAVTTTIFTFSTMICAQWRVSWISKRSLTAMMSQRISRIFFIVTIHHRNHLLCGQSKLVYILLNQWSHQQSSSKKSGAILSSQMSSLSLRLGNGYTFIHQLAPLFVVALLLLQYANGILQWQQLYSLFQQWFVLSEGWVESQRDHSQLWWVRGYPEFFYCDYSP